MKSTDAYLEGRPAVVTSDVVDGQFVLTAVSDTGTVARLELSSSDGLTLADQITIAIHNAGGRT